jgi:hypothetical protein
MKKDIFKYACINALLTAFYIGLISSILFYGPRYFAFAEEPDTVFAPIMMLMLFVFSATITATLVLGRPILWYMDGKKKEGVSLFLYTLFVFFIIMVVAFAALITVVA